VAHCRLSSSHHTSEADSEWEHSALQQQQQQQQRRSRRQCCHSSSSRLCRLGSPLVRCLVLLPLQQQHQHHLLPLLVRLVRHVLLPVRLLLLLLLLLVVVVCRRRRRKRRGLGSTRTTSALCALQTRCVKQIQLGYFLFVTLRLVPYVAPTTSMLVSQAHTWG
jgi:hypothetical protein